MTEASITSQLKDAGNALYLKKDYLGAYAKYSEAIIIDGENAVLYANRSACSLAMAKYLDGAGDAQKATELQPSYAKAWGRLAAAQAGMFRYDRSIGAWRRALSVLPKEDLSPAELRQKTEFEEGLKAAEKKAEIVNSRGKPEGCLEIPHSEEEMLPWRIAQRMLPELQRGKEKTMRSSAWVIWTAYEDFRRGTETLKKLKVTSEGDKDTTVSTTGVIADLTNGILRDRRIFHVDSKQWMENYNRQVEFEVGVNKAWPGLTSEQVMVEAAKRLRESGWNEVRHALSTTIRVWVMLGLLESSVGSAHHVAIEFLRKAIEVLDWGRTTWKDVPTSDRGVVFEDTFIRGVRVLYLETYIQAYSADPGPNSKFPLGLLFEEADDLIKEATKNHPKPVEIGGTIDPGFISAFYIYPIGVGFSTQGFYHSQTALLVEDPEEIYDHHSKAAEYYLKAASIYPEDDDCHAWYLRCAVEYLWKSGATLRTTLPVLKRMREAIPTMQKIWGAMKTERREELDIYVEAETMLRGRLDKGEVTLDDPAAPAWAVDGRSGTISLFPIRPNT